MFDKVYCLKSVVNTYTNSSSASLHTELSTLKLIYLPVDQNFLILCSLPL